MTGRRRDTSRDGFKNKAELHLLSNYRLFWKLIQKSNWLTRRVNKGLINMAVGKVPFRPHRLSTRTPYPSWSSLTDRTWMGRHLPPDPEFNDPGNLPPVEDVVELFRMPTKQDILSPKSTVLFPYFVQWFSDGFLRVTSDRDDDKSVDPLDPALPAEARVSPVSVDPAVRMHTTSNHQIDLSTVYGLNERATVALRAFEGGRLKSQVINGQEYPPFFYSVTREYPAADVIDPQFEGVYRPTKLESLQPPERKAKCFVTGVDRGNVQIGFVALNTICLREHNRLCGLIERSHPDWDDERLFQTARNTVIGIIVRIVVEEYINHIAPYHFEFVLDPEAFRDAPWYRENWMTIEFSMVYRWHMVLPSWLHHGGADVPMEESMFNNEMLIDMGLGALFGEASAQPAGAVGLHNTPDFLLHLERTTIEWGRENQLRSYNDYREYCKFPRVTAFDQITSDREIQGELERIYGHVDRIEFYPGIIAEDLRPGSALPSLIGRLIGIDAFSQAYTSPLLAERVFDEETFSEVGWAAIHSTRKLQDLVHRNVSEEERRFRVTFDQLDAK